MNSANISGFATGAVMTASRAKGFSQQNDNGKNSMDFMQLVNRSMDDPSPSGMSGGRQGQQMVRDTGSFRSDNSASRAETPRDSYTVSGEKSSSTEQNVTGAAQGANEAAETQAVADAVNEEAAQESAEILNQVSGEAAAVDEIPSEQTDPIMDIKAAFSEIRTALMDFVTEKMDVTDEDFIEAMEVLGLNFADLMNVQNQTDLLSELSNISPEMSQGEFSVSYTRIDITVNINMAAVNTDAGATDFSDILSGISKIISGVLEDFGIASERFSAVIDDIINGNMPVPPEFTTVIDYKYSEQSFQYEGGIQINPMPDGFLASQGEVIPSADGITPVDPFAGHRLFDQGASDGVKIINIIDSSEEELQTPPVSEEAVLAEEGIVSAGEELEEQYGEEADSGEEDAIPGREAALPEEFEEPENESVESFRPIKAEPGVNPGVQIAQNTANAVVSNLQERSEDIRYTTINVQDVMNQIVTTASVEITENVQRVEMTLNPQNLGRLIMQVQQSEGAVTARLIAQNAAVKDILETQMAELRQSLEQKGVKVDAVEVAAGTHEFERNLEEGQNTPGEQYEKNKEDDGGSERGSRMRNLRSDELDELQGVMSEEEMLAARIMRDNGNSIDFSA